MSPRKQFSGAYKARVALAALKEQKTTQVIASEYGVHPTQIAAWKKEALAVLAEGMQDKRRRRETDRQEQEAALHEQIGKLTMQVEWFKKNRCLPVRERRTMINQDDARMSVREQCRLLEVARSGVYYAPALAREVEVRQVLLDMQTRRPAYGTRKLRQLLVRAGYRVEIDLVRRMKKEMGLRAILPKPRLSMNGRPHRRFPYVLTDVVVRRPNQVWVTDITYVRLPSGFVYVVAINDLYSRYIVAWDLSTSLEAGFCVRTLEEALARHGVPEIFNSDQGVQFTSEEFVAVLERAGVRISMDGKGRVFDNILMERFWRTLKQEEVYQKRYESVMASREGIGAFVVFYNHDRLHAALEYRTPADVYGVTPNQEVA
jgi:putative transposase